MDADLKPLPRAVQWWRKSRNQRQQALKTFNTVAAKALTLAISLLGATLVSYGAWMIYAPAGFIVGGLLCWVVLWSNEQDKRRTE